VLVAEAAEARAGFNRIALTERTGIGRTAFARGDGVAALGALLPAAIAGDAEAQFLVGRVYEAGLGVAADPSEAVAWMALAALQGHAGALAAVEAAGAKLDGDQLERATRLAAVRAPRSGADPLGVQPR